MSTSGSSSPAPSAAATAATATAPAPAPAASAAASPAPAPTSVPAPAAVPMPVSVSTPAPPAPSTAAPPSLPVASASAPTSAPTSALTAAPAAAAQHVASPPQQQLASSRPSDAPSQEPVVKNVVVPRCSTWFAMDAINAIEKRMLPEFFVNEALYRNFPPGAKASSSKTPQIYMKYRNFMISAYRQQPHVYLTATACRRNLAGDACAILRVHEFLTHWGLINYSVPPHAMPPAIHANYALKPASSSSSSASASASVGSASSPIAVLHDGSKPQQRRQRACEACGVGDVAFELSPDAKRKITDVSNGSSSNGATKEMALGTFCAAPGSGLCDECYLNRATVFPDGVDASDFVRVEQPAQWTQDETKLLLESVAASGRDTDESSCDWNVIAAKIRTKTAEDCMLHFLELPILQQAGVSSLASASSSANAADVLQRPFAYAQAMNASVLDMSALVSQVDPFVAKAAARAAIRAVQTLHTMPVATRASGDIKSESTAAPSSSTATAQQNGDDTMNGENGAALQEAAAAVASSAAVAGIADPVKNEVGADGDVEMKSVSDGEAAATSSSAVPLTKEVVAVVNEASSATAVALLAVRAHAITESTAKGPVRDLVTELLQNQLQQMELKMQQLGVLESAVLAEKEKLTQEKYQLYVDRLAFAQEKLGGGDVGSANAL